MKTKTSKWMAFLLLAAGLLLLTACKANVITEIKPDGSGSFAIEYGFTADEISTYGMVLDDQFCNTLAEDSDDMPSGTVSQETRGEETWCVFTSPFATLDDLRVLYSDMEMTITDLRISDGKAYYDVSIDMSGDTGTMGMMEMYWVVKMPGTISQHNATEVDGSTLRWDMSTGGILHATATSSTGGSSTIWWVVGISLSCLCLLVLAIAAGVVIYLVSRKKKAAVNAG